MRALLNKHITYKAYPEILSNYDGIVREASNNSISNGLGLHGRLYIQVNNQKILLPAPLHPMLLSAVDGNEGKYVVEHNGKQNGPFLGVGCAKWLQNFAITSARILESKEKQELYSQLDELNKEDLTRHGRIGEGIYVLFDLIKAHKDGIKYHSPTISEYKFFITDLQNICQGKEASIDGHIKDLPQELKNIMTSREGAIYRYAVEQFPEMIKPNNKIPYYNLSKNIIDDSTIPKSYQEDFNNKVSDKTFIEKANLKKLHNIHDVTSPNKHQSNNTAISNTTLAFIISTAILFIAGITTLSLSLFDVVNMSNISGFVILATAGASSIATGLSVTYSNKAKLKDSSYDKEIDSMKSVEDTKKDPNHWRLGVEDSRSKEDISLQ